MHKRYWLRIALQGTVLIAILVNATSGCTKPQSRALHMHRQVSASAFRKDWV